MGAAKFKDYIEQIERFAHDVEAAYATTPGERAEGGQGAASAMISRIGEFIDWPRRTGVQPKS